MYGLAVIFFVAAGACFALLSGDQRSLAVVSTIVLGLLALGLGYSQRSRSATSITTTQPEIQPTTASIQPETAQAVPTQPTMSTEETRTDTISAPIPKKETEIVVAPITAIQEKPKTEMQQLMEIPVKTETRLSTETPSLNHPPITPAFEITHIKGIKEKRAAQLRSLGIANPKDLAKSSANDIAHRLKISPKIVENWIAEAKQLTGTK